MIFMKDKENCIWKINKSTKASSEMESLMAKEHSTVLEEL